MRLLIKRNWKPENRTVICSAVIPLEILILQSQPGQFLTNLAMSCFSPSVILMK